MVIEQLRKETDKLISDIAYLCLEELKSKKDMLVDTLGYWEARETEEFKSLVNEITTIMAKYT